MPTADTSIDLPARPVSDRGVLTLATGKQKYLDMAVALGRSLALHSPHLSRAVITDSDDPRLHRLYQHVVAYQPQFGGGVEQKLSLHRYSPFACTMFIDADSLALGDVAAGFDCFAHTSFGLVGRELATGNWYDADWPALLQRLHLPAYSEFNSGLIVFRRDAQAEAVFTRAKELVPRYREFGFNPFRNSISDEPLLSLALAEQGIAAIDDGGRFYRPLANIESPLTIDVLRGIIRFRRYFFDGRVWARERPRPVLLHFPGLLCWEPLYERECRKLELLEAHPDWSRAEVSRRVNWSFNPRYFVWAAGKRLWGRIRHAGRRPKLPLALGLPWP